MKLLPTFFIFVILILFSIGYSTSVLPFEDPCAGGGCDPPDPCADGSCNPPIEDPCANGGCDNPDPCADGSCDPPITDPCAGGGCAPPDPCADGSCEPTPPTPTPPTPTPPPPTPPGPEPGPTPTPCTSAAWSCTAFPTICPASGIKTRTCTLIDTACTNPNAVKPSETQSCMPVEEKIYVKKLSGELFVSSLILDPECIAPGNELFLFTSVKNQGKKKLKDVKIIVTVQDIDIRAVAGPFIIKERSSVSRLIYFNVPSDIEPGIYYIRTAVTSNTDSTAKYRIFEVNNAC